jgi:hypothetical protein
MGRYENIGKELVKKKSRGKNERHLIYFLAGEKEHCFVRRFPGFAHSSF